MMVFPRIFTSCYEIALKGDLRPFSGSMEISEPGQGIECVTVGLSAKQPSTPSFLELSWEHTVDDALLRWSPGTMPEDLPDSAGLSLEDLAEVKGPVLSLFGADGVNRLTFAFSDRAEHVMLGADMGEESRAALCAARIFVLPVAPFTEYSGTLRLDMRTVSPVQAVLDVNAWWEEITPA